MKLRHAGLALGGLSVVTVKSAVAAQHTRYKLIDIGTFGGPASYFTGAGIGGLSKTLWRTVFAAWNAQPDITQNPTEGSKNKYLFASVHNGVKALGTAAKDSHG